MTITEAKATIYANVVYACEKAGLAPQTTQFVQDACDTIIALADACETIVALADRKTEPSIDIIRCKDCDNYAGEGMYCAWNVLTGDMGYCHHARPKGSTDITAEQTEPTVSKMEQVDKDIYVRSKDEPQTDCKKCKYAWWYDERYRCPFKECRYSQTERSE